MNAPDLKPCPFCGGPASIHKGMQAFDDFEVHCDPCGICGPNFGSMGETLTPKEDAIAAWNTRTPLAEALAVPEVAALVYAAKMVMHDLHHGNGLEGLYANRDRLDAALRAIGGDA